MVSVPGNVVIMPGALGALGDTVRAAAPKHRVVVITDTVVRDLHGTRVASAIGAELLAIPAGEEHKTRATWQQLTDDMLDRGLGRDTTVVALGGGVVGDLAGFVAATYMRGVPVIQVPTTLLAMVDASVGGKTGVDTPVGKNLVGAFHQPVAVVIDPLVLETLPAHHIRSGFAEIVKHGAVADAQYFERVAAFIERWPLGRRDSLTELTPIIERSVQIKSEIVARDERESGLRKILNFGHTIGHAIEAAMAYGVLHGEAVAMGLVTEARLAENLGVATKGTARVIERTCRAAGLPTAIPGIDPQTILGFTRSDKKARTGRVEYALPVKIGEMAGGDRGWAIPVEDDVVLTALSQ